ncbi:hypothetical protein GXW83_07155 [Streptacidiphilus sp. PB12-B1b]|uniref:hypothetical protein n=1 Tax=Streptacidiphilus sp. PB12-B1b TaxID=2705012 RepID=UPI0015F86A73|nr:hypothetical protein [Streptacidiphilus sp. PB12-B1b]QMU75549.1 hypothetical protein GXW83_07155 [Streptacidiphilus sp. PB12-B1b]
MGRRRQGARPAGAADPVLTSIEGGASRSASALGAHPSAPRGREAVTGAVRAAAQEDAGDRARLWHVVLSVAGQPTPLSELKRGLEQLAHDHTPFLTARYATDHGEIRYWEQAEDLHDAAAMALRLWGEHKASAKLPPWEIVGLEVVDRSTYHKRIAEGYGESPASVGGVHPF